MVQLPSNETRPRLSVIIVSYKCRELLAQCLESVRADPPRGATEIIVVDNDSRDGSVEMVRAQYPDVVLIANQDNRGFPAANNQALVVARAGAFLLLNPDTLVTPTALSTLIQFLEREPEAKIVGLNVRNPDGTAQHSTRDPLPTATQFIVEQIDLLPALLGRSDPAHPPPSDAVSTEPQRVGAVSGAALAFTRAVTEKIGVFDEDMFWAEDLDFCFRAAAAGIPVFYLPAAKILHYGGQSGKRNYRRMLYAQHSSRIVFVTRHFGTAAGLVMRSIFAVMLPIKMTVRLAQMSRPSRREENRDRLSGYWDSLKFCVTLRL